MKRIWLWILVWCLVASGLAGGYWLLPKKPVASFSFKIFQTAVKAVHQGRYELAVDSMSSLVRHHEDNVYFRTLLAEAQDFQIGEMEEGPERDELIQAALDNFHAAMDSAPRFLRPRIGLAALLRDLERYDEARALLDQALEQNPYSDEAHEEYAWLLLDLGDLEGAGEHAVYTLDERYDPSLLGREKEYELEEKVTLSRTERILVHHRPKVRIIDPALYQFWQLDSAFERSLVRGLTLTDLHMLGPDIHTGTFLPVSSNKYLVKYGLELVSLEILSVEPTDPPEIPAAP